MGDLFCAEEENLKEVWKTEVEAVVEAKGLSCELNWDKGEMTVSATRRTDNRLDDDIVCRGGRALYVLACGLSTQWVLTSHPFSFYSYLNRVIVYVQSNCIFIKSSCSVVLLLLLFPT